MEALLALVVSKFGPVIIGAGALFTAVLGGWWHGRRTQKQVEQDRQNRERLDAIETSRKVEGEVAANDPRKNREELKRW